MNWIKNNIKFDLSMKIGIFLLIVALAVWVISIIEIVGNEVMLTQNLSIEEMWRFDGALNWWQAIYSTIIIPSTIILVLSGILSMASQQILIRLTQKDAFDKFEVTLQQACKIDSTEYKHE